MSLRGRNPGCRSAFLPLTAPEKYLSCLRVYLVIPLLPLIMNGMRRRPIPARNLHVQQPEKQPGFPRRSRKKFGFSEKSTYLAIVKAPETIVSKARTNETDDTYNIKRIAYREKFYSL